MVLLARLLCNNISHYTLQGCNSKFKYTFSAVCAHMHTCICVCEVWPCGCVHACRCVHM